MVSFHAFLTTDLFICLLKNKIDCSFSFAFFIKFIMVLYTSYIKVVKDVNFKVVSKILQMVWNKRIKCLIRYIMCEGT